MYEEKFLKRSISVFDSLMVVSLTGNPCNILFIFIIAKISCHKIKISNLLPEKIIKQPL